MTTLRPSATTTVEQVEKVKALQDRLAKALNFVRNNVEETKNRIGGVVGYHLNLSDDETETLWKILEGKE